MTDQQQNYQLIKQKDDSVIVLRDVINIYHGESLKDLLLTAIAYRQNIIINMADLHEIDLAIMQLLVSTKMTAVTHGLTLTLSPVSDQAKHFLDLSALSFE
ncbi:MAG: STAS domain-containing protein, partial [Psychromonas sp.]|nr:STAS domain-containing protein [Psychromonas sp.]